MKKYILGLIIALAAPVLFAYAATPLLSVSGDGSDSVTVRVTGGELNAPVVLFYNQIGGNVQQRNIGSTDVNGNFTGAISTSGLGITQASPVYVQVGGYQSLPANWPSGTASSTSTGAIITFDPASPTFTVGQSGTVMLSGGGNGTYYISSNSNPNWTSTSINGNTLTVNGAQAGQTTLTVCSTAGPCAVLTPTFNSTGTSNTTTSSPYANSTSNGTTGTVGAPTVNQSILNLGMGGQGTLSLSGGTSPYTVSVLSGNNVSTTLLGNTLYVTGSASGTATLNICSQQSSTSNSLCTPVTVNVSGTASNTNGSTSGTNTGSTMTGTTGTGVSFSLPISAGEAVRLSLNGGNGSYYIQPISGSTVNTAVNGNTLTITGLSQGNATVNVCSGDTNSSTSATCTPIVVSVGPALTGTGGGFFFESDLSQGMSGEDVTELQQRLHDLGFFNTTVTGFFGPLTASAVKAYQAANGISATGFVGPLTRAAFNK